MFSFTLIGMDAENSRQISNQHIAKWKILIFDVLLEKVSENIPMFIFNETIICLKQMQGLNCEIL